MSKLIVTAPNHGIYLVDTETKEFTRKHEDIRALGITRIGDYYLLADRVDRVYVLDKDLNIEDEFIKWEDRKSAHDIVIENGLVYVVDSSTNSILVYTSWGKYLNTFSLFQNTKENTHHINSLRCYDGKFYLSMFNFDVDQLKVKPSFELSPVENPDVVLKSDVKFPYPTGAVVRFDPVSLKVEEVLAHGLYHPHSIHLVNNEIHYVESLRRTLKRGKSDLYTIDTSYLRGVASDSDHIYLGGSTFRHGDGPRLQATIDIIDKEYNPVDKLTLPFEGAHEIYDILVVDHE